MELHMYFLSIGFLVVLAAGIWTIIKGFQIHAGWGFGLIFVPPVALFFLFAHWNDAKRPFFMNLLGLAFIGLGIYISEMSKTA